MIFISIAATLQRLPGPLAGQARAKVQIDVDSASAHSVPSEGDTEAYSGTFVIFTGCVEGDRVTHVFFCNSTTRRTLRGLTSDAVVIQPGTAQFSVIPHVRQKGIR